MEDWQQRVLEEYQQLRTRRLMLGAHLAGSAQLLPAADLHLLQQQFHVMGDYQTILESRMRRFNGAHS